MDWLRRGLLLLSAVGLLASGSGLALIVVGPDELEEATKAEVIPRVEARIRDLMAIETAQGNGGLVAIRNRLVEKSRDMANRMLGADFAERIRTQIAEFCVCRMSEAEQQDVLRRYGEARARLKQKFAAVLGGKLSELKPEEGMLGALVAGYYVDTVHGLQHELKIFFGVNLALFALVGAAFFAAPPSRGLVVPAGALSVSTIWAAYLFVFDQDWLAKIVFHHWTGYGHLALVGVILVYLLYLAGLMIRIRRIGTAGRS